MQTQVVQRRREVEPADIIEMLSRASLKGLCLNNVHTNHSIICTLEIDTMIMIVTLAKRQPWLDLLRI